MSFASWGEPDGIPEGSDFRLEAVLTRNAAKDAAGVTSSGTITLSAESSVLNSGVAILTDVATSSKSQITTGLLAAWEIADTQSSAWDAGTYQGDIKLVDSGGTITYWPVTIKIRTAID